jgi:hypothetical protein
MPSAPAQERGTPVPAPSGDRRSITKGTPGHPPVPAPRGALDNHA